MRYLALILLALATPRPIHAQSDSADVPINALSALSELDAIQITLVNQVSAAYRWQPFEAFPLRTRVDLSFSAEDIHNSDPYNLPTYIRNSDAQVFHTKIGLTLQYSTILSRADPVQFYFAVGPHFALDHIYTKHRTSYDPPVAQPETREYSTTTWWAGAVASIGLECHVYRNVTILTEYNLTGTYSKYTNSPSDKAYTSRRWTLALSSITIGLGVHL